MKTLYNAEVLENSAIAEGIYSLWLHCPDAAAIAKAGQFAAVYVNDSSMLLPRPLSICEVNQEKTALRVVYRLFGKGTREISRTKIGQFLWILAPLGNGFDLDTASDNVALVGGGIGVPPLLELTKSIKKALPDGKISVFIGFRDASSVILENDFYKYTETVCISTDDGSYGKKGNAVDLIKDMPKYDVIYACGPNIMMKNLAIFAKKTETACYVSVEERMACAIGACLACVTEVIVDGVSSYQRVCAVGPVFNARELVWK